MIAYAISFIIHILDRFISNIAIKIKLEINNKNN